LLFVEPNPNRIKVFTSGHHLHFENSPAIYGWVHAFNKIKVPQGRQMFAHRPISFVPTGLDCFGFVDPRLKPWAIFIGAFHAKHFPAPSALGVCDHHKFVARKFAMIDKF
jgi:hypothetical protein